MLKGSIVLDHIGKRYATVVSSDEAVNGVTTAYSDIIFIGGMQSIGLWIRANSAGAPDVSVYIEYSPTQTAADFTEVKGGSKVIDLTNTSPQTDVVILVNNNYARLKYVGNAGNAGDTNIDAVINKAFGDLN
jgi:hypothetical protein